MCVCVCVCVCACVCVCVCVSVCVHAGVCARGALRVPRFRSTIHQQSVKGEGRKETMRQPSVIRYQWRRISPRARRVSQTIKVKPLHLASHRPHHQQDLHHYFRQLYSNPF